MQPPIRCKPELFEQDLTGRTYVVTGANSGVGLATTEQLAKQGARIVAGCRAADAADAFGAHAGQVDVVKLDLNSLSSVRSFAEAVIARYDRLDGLVNNAGVMHCPEGRTEDGFETQFGVNYLGHFLLTELLLDRLKSSAPSRIVCVSSVLHAGTAKQVGEIDFDDLDFSRRGYNKEHAYTQSKLANVLHALELAKRLEGTGVTAYSVHPGWVRSNLAKHVMPVWVQNVLMRPFSGLLGMMSPGDGAQTTLHCLLSEEALAHSGEYYSQTSLLYPDKANRGGGWPMQSPNPNARDEALAMRLREESRLLVGLEA